MALKTHPSHTTFPLQSHFSQDNEVADRVRRFLHNQGVAADQLAIESTGGNVILRGRVSTRSDKELCLQCSRRVAGVVNVIDELDLAESTWRTRPK